MNTSRTGERPRESAAPVFHAGELALQRAAGSAERLARVGSQVIRDHLPEQHRQFFALLPCLIVGSLDDRGQPSASLLSGPPGFISSPDPHTLRIEAAVPTGDRLARQLAPGEALGLLGIQPHTRRRNRANGRVIARDASGFSLAIDQSFGNCPRYITPRELVYGGAPAHTSSVQQGLGPEQRALIENADTFFIASAHPDAAHSPSAAHGVDVSHRGGPPGFAHFIDADSFIVPDLRGNDFYNTLGNLQLQPRAGLLFVDFQRGDLLSLQTHTETLLGAHPAAHAAATGRILRFHIQDALWLRGASAIRELVAQ